MEGNKLVCAWPNASSSSQKNEQHEQWLADYAALKRKRDAVADELQEAYRRGRILRRMPLRTSARTSNAAPQDRIAIRAARKRARLPCYRPLVALSHSPMNGCKATGCFRSPQILRTGPRFGGFRPEKGGSIWPSHSRRGG
jgi:hypothetical protein